MLALTPLHPCKNWNQWPYHQHGLLISDSLGELNAAIVKAKVTYCITHNSLFPHAHLPANSWHMLHATGIPVLAPDTRDAEESFIQQTDPFFDSPQLKLEQEAAVAIPSFALSARSGHASRRGGRGRKCDLAEI